MIAMWYFQFLIGIQTKLFDIIGEKWNPIVKFIFVCYQLKYSSFIKEIFQIQFSIVEIFSHSWSVLVSLC